MASGIPSATAGRLLLALAVLVAGRDAPATQLATLPADFVQPGTQPSAAEFGDFLTPTSCALCHGGYGTTGAAPSDAWPASLMAQAARDPLMRAAASIANADAAGSAETCIRCHAPVGWLGGRSTGGLLANLTAGDLEGVTCHFCHRLVDPIARAGAPAADAAILAALEGAGTRPGGRCADGAPCVADADCGAAAPCAVDAGQGRFVVDPDDARRGPRTIEFHLHPTTASPLHASADVCAPCHDVSTPTLTRGPDGTYALNALGAPHPTQDPNAMFPEQRTYSEWRASAFAAGGVVFPDGRFGGARTAALPNAVAVSTCQDCHMPTVAERACMQGDVRPDLAGHFFAGANSWVLGAVLDEHGSASGLTTAAVDAARARTEAMLAAAADVEVTQEGRTLRVRVVNQTGHKLPTGYPEGRRMWLGVRFLGAGDAPLGEDGAYDATTATLDVAHTTKIYEVKQVVAGDVAAASGLPVGTPFHLALSSAVAFDDRIPPRGFTQAAFDVFGGAPVGVTYADGQHWDDTPYTIPLGTVRAEVSLWYQTTSREYAEFLRDAAPDASGQNAHDRWAARGRSAPVLMKRVSADVAPVCDVEAAPCDDGAACTTGDTCSGGLCAGAPVVCPDDGNPCTADVCVPATGTCGMPAGGACDDGDACTSGDACTAGVCGGTVEGGAGTRCLLDRLAAGHACAEPLPRRLARFVAARTKRAAALTRAWERKSARGAKTKVLLRLLDAADRAVASVATRAVPPRAPAACADAIAGLVARERDALARLRAATAASTGRPG